MHWPVPCAVIGQRGVELAIVSTNTAIGRFAREESLVKLGGQRHVNGSICRSPISGWQQATIASCVRTIIHNGAMVYIATVTE
jgi:hypothetical protein